jgi:hypothetical protein
VREGAQHLEQMQRQFQMIQQKIGRQKKGFTFDPRRKRPPLATQTGDSPEEKVSPPVKSRNIERREA